MIRLPLHFSAVTVVTGTDTDVGKTVTTAALASALLADGHSVAVYKPVQTGVAGNEAGDAAEVKRLSGAATAEEGIRLARPMAPVPAAALEGRILPTLADHAAAVRRLAATHRHVLVEGSGGLLVELDGDGHTVADLAAALGGGVVVVCRSGLGTLNHTMLTLEALTHRGLTAAGLVVGSLPDQPSMVERSNLDFLEALPIPLLACLPAGAAALEPAEFRRLAARGSCAEVFHHSAGLDPV
ncbi:8-amino-7-oxononanoate synthase/dethiobiotin synthetase [Arthrobacter silviterrae]|uniref:ATP-dependent dethiobiotin synthetase BioD n=1 Tax=Arthrobacter silviterrae TaxID=2026658 RepID=A0ABX0DBQ0_9MICC|nr:MULTISPECIES: dethiobiotin synthase [Arthrobacter]MCU6479998.1 dethiobiotin synthase [Arthrobacter sp. A2-55]MDQ0276015.1 8-amino-7-oxononanoate synthase/dethiobiotin synthetase [Arthrobacter silviterrae]NGN84352.1 ATP-dependent dethiobiotin synthetase BioD [Arthrobacter silviterrae]